MQFGSWDLQELVTHVEHELVHLPAFQRQFVWDTDQTVTLFDSLIRRIPVGSLTLAVPTFGIGVAPVDRGRGDDRGKVPDYKYLSEDDFDRRAKKAREELGGKRECYLLLDGQQRVTSIFRGLKGIDPVFIVFEGNARTFGDVSQIAQHVSEVVSEDGASYLHMPLDVAFRGDALTDAELTECFAGSRYGRSLKEAGPEHFTAEAPRFQTLARQLSRFFFGGTEVPFVVAEAAQEDLILFFERSNTKGTVLGFFDLLNAKSFDAFGGTALESFSKALQSEVKKVPDKYRIGKYEEHFVRARCYEALLPRVGGENPLKKSTILKHVEGKDLYPDFGKWVTEFSEPVKFLQSERVTTYHDGVPFPLMAVPTFFFLKQLEFKETRITKSQREFFQWWYWASLFSERYSYKSNEAALEDIELLRRVARKEKNAVTRKYVDQLSNRLDQADKVLTLSAGRGHFQKGILQLGVFLHDSADLLSGKALSAIPMQIFKNKRSKPLDLHHIFPKDFLDKSGYTGAFRDSLCNVMYATDPAHRGVSEPPSVYLAPGFEKKLYGDAIKTHFVDTAMYARLMGGGYDNDFDSFVGDRARLISSEIEEVAGKDRGLEVVEALP
jgi:hypothetical protein